MTIAQNRVVSIDYTITDDKNRLLDSTFGQAPLDYLHGCGNIIPGLENALEGRFRGDHFSITIPAAEAYGERDERLIAEIPVENFKDIDRIEPGMRFHTQTAEGPRMITVIRVGNAAVTIDGNHPLAGLNLTFDVTVTGVRDAGEEELLHGHVQGHDHDGCCGGGCRNCGCGGCKSL